ncbi:protein NRT1/ PTR FAMILY 4.6 [Arachis ipaensis]|uniref:protein NRT1/ PTR FAMILY 4.6 n=1 Tax=Arachis ipaensis TaxID=130454 RepID=UPI0007AF10DB|nr:protein NRT1/ PTR FAMILY 4.6 [Arachis ipaensis]
MRDKEEAKAWEKKGGFRAAMFVFVLSALDNMGLVANMVSMVLYFYGVMHFDLSSSANTLTNFLGSTFLLSLVGAFISDTYLNRLTTCLLFGSLEVTALVVVTIQAGTKALQPEACGKSSCVKGGVAVMLYTSLCLLALGSGGVRGSMTALGADQFEEKDPKEGKGLATYFNWLLLSTTLGSVVGVTGVVWVSTQRAWYLGFLIVTVSSFLGFLTLALGKPFYRILPPSQSPLSRILQVFLFLLLKCKMGLDNSNMIFYGVLVCWIRFLDKAAVLQGNFEPKPWKVCTVTQVEEVKILTRMLPILASTIIMNTCLAQLQTFSVQQGNVMNLKLGSFTVPPASIPVIPLLFLCILIPIYEFFFVPFARKITNHPSGVTQLQRVGVGLVLSSISMTVAGIIEVKRRDQARKDPSKPISLFWLSFQYAIFGIADMFTQVGLLEFFYREAPKTMKSLSTSFTWLAMSIGYFLSTVFVNVINSITKRVAPSKQGWLHGFDLNSNNLNLFYWFLAILSCINFFNFVYWACWYKYKSEEEYQDGDQEPRARAKSESETKHMKMVHQGMMMMGKSSQTSEANSEGPSSSDETEDGQRERSKV